MMIREEGESEAAAIAALIAEAFQTAPHADGTEAEIVTQLRAAGALRVSLVAGMGGRLVGHVAFSPVLLAGQAGWVGLGPLAVALPDRRRGIGAALVRAGLARLRAMGARGCVVLGNPAYYRRFGFIPDAGPSLAGVPPEVFLALAFDGEMPVGPVAYHRAFGIADH